ncbi:MAG: hypothetical protein AAFU49_00310 [Pseudomonadota bacterium]
MEPKAVLRIVGVLSFSQAILGQFMIHGVPLFLRDAGQSADAVALTYLAAIPFALRFLWGPLIDRYGGPRFGPFGTWILGGQVASAVLICGLAFGDPGGAVAPLIAAMFCTMVAVGTQQTATSGLMIQHLRPVDYASGASTQAVGATLAGILLGAGVLYGLGDLGWSVVVSSVALLSGALLVLIVFWLRLDIGFERPAVPVSLASQFAIFAKPAARRLYGLSLLVAACAVLPYSFKSILLIDAGFTVAESGLIGIVLGNLTGMLGALVARGPIRRFGGLRVLGAVGFAGATIAIATVVAESVGGFGAWATCSLVLAANFLVYVGFTANRSLLMGLCGKGRQATDFATFASLEAIAVLMIAAGGTALLDRVGLSQILIVCVLFSLLGGVLAWRGHTRQIATPA